MTSDDHDNHYAMQWSSSSWKLIINCNVQWILKMKMSHVAKRNKYCIVKNCSYCKRATLSCSILIFMFVALPQKYWRNLKTLINSQHNIFIFGAFILESAIKFSIIIRIFNCIFFTIYYNCSFIDYVVQCMYCVVHFKTIY